jgi:hypothetical protein
LVALAQGETTLQSWFITTFISIGKKFTVLQLDSFQKNLENLEDFFNAMYATNTDDI